MGLRWQLGDWGFLKRDIDTNENYDKFRGRRHGVQCKQNTAMPMV